MKINLKHWFFTLSKEYLTLTRKGALITLIRGAKFPTTGPADNRIVYNFLLKFNRLECVPFRRPLRWH